jgi:peptide/nickel transport system ATP-binding protein
MSQSILRVRNLRVVFPHRHGELVAIDDISFDVRKGEILGFVGESGAGKSMTGAAIIGLIDPPGYIERGEIWLDDERIDQLDSGAMTRIRGDRISMVFQDPLTSLNPLRTIGDQLVETIQTHLPVSGGMRQRVVIALALSAEPELIIADEPTTALDVSVQAQVLKLLRRLCQEHGASVILITHDMGVIAETTDRVAVLYAGRLAEIGPTAEVLNEPQHPYSRGLIASTPSVEQGDIDTRLFQISGAMPRLDELPAGCAFNPRCEHRMERCVDQRPDLLQDRVSCWLYADG